MVPFGGPECHCGLELRRQGHAVFISELLLGKSQTCRRRLFRRMRVNAGPVLPTAVVALAVHCGWVDAGKESVEQSVVRALRRIVVDNNGLCVTRRSTAHLVVVGFFECCRTIDRSCRKSDITNK